MSDIEFNELMNIFKNTDGYYLGDYSCFDIADYMEQLFRDNIRLKQDYKEIKEIIQEVQKLSVEKLNNELCIGRDDLNEILSILEETKSIWIGDDLNDN